LYTGFGAGGAMVFGAVGSLGGVSGPEYEFVGVAAGGGGGTASGR
jgi:hypothetical protein